MSDATAALAIGTDDALTTKFYHLSHVIPSPRLFMKISSVAVGSMYIYIIQSIAAFQHPSGSVCFSFIFLTFQNTDQSAWHYC